MHIRTRLKRLLHTRPNLKGLLHIRAVLLLTKRNSFRTPSLNRYSDWARGGAVKGVAGGGAGGGDGEATASDPEVCVCLCLCVCVCVCYSVMRKVLVECISIG